MLSIPGPHLINHMDSSHMTTKKGHTFFTAPLQALPSPPRCPALLATIGLKDEPEGCKVTTLNAQEEVFQVTSMQS